MLWQPGLASQLLQLVYDPPDDQPFGSVRPHQGIDLPSGTGPAQRLQQEPAPSAITGTEPGKQGNAVTFGHHGLDDVEIVDPVGDPDWLAGTRGNRFHNAGKRKPSAYRDP
jgi:hypothetical protein